MFTLKISENQFVSLIDQLSDHEKQQILDHLLFASDTSFASACKIGERSFQRVCEARGMDPNKMTEDEKLSLVDEILHENNS